MGSNLTKAFVPEEKILQLGPSVQDLGMEMGKKPSSRPLMDTLSPSTRRVCIWGGGGLSLTFVLDSLKQLRIPVSWVKRVHQRNGIRRYDCFVEAGREEEFVEKLGRMRGSWRVRVDCKPADRPVTLQKSGQTKLITNSELRTVSWNIAGLDRKRGEVEDFLSLQNPDVIAFQETNRTSWTRRKLRLHGYCCVEAPADEKIQGSHGIVLGVRKASGFTLESLGEPAPFYCFGMLKGKLRTAPVFCTGEDWKVVHPTRPQSIKVIVGSVYVPSGPIRKHVLEALANHLNSLIRRYPDTPIISIGDWNVSRLTLQNWMSRKGISGRVVQSFGNPNTFSRKDGRTSAIDHSLLIGVEGKTRMSVKREWDLSDHWPIEVISQMGWHGIGSGGPLKEQLHRQKIACSAESIVHSNRWAPLLLLEASEGEKLVEEFTQISHRIARERHILVKRVEREKRLNLSHTAKRVINQRRQLYKQLKASSLDKNEEVMRVAYEEAREKARMVIREEKRRLFLAWILRAYKEWRRREMRLFWRWIKTTASYRVKRQAAIGIVDPMSNEVVTEPMRVASIWAKHFSELAHDHSGHSKDPGYWPKQLANRPQIQGNGGNEEEERPLQWRECAMVIKGMDRGKAAGLDGIPAEWYKLVIKGGEEAEWKPSTPMAKALWKVLKGIWDGEVIPMAWSEATVVPVPKKGDLTRTDNYRGIALIQVGMKILSSVLSRRLQRLAERKGLVNQAQAGFRSREEALGQVAALYEICRRRRIEGRRTLVMFVDFAKAYDSVPHAALLRKLSVLGIKGKLLKLLSEMYRAPRLSVKTPDGTQSESMPLELGVRQGCPSSPILFNLYINDLVDELEMEGRGGVQIPGIKTTGKRVGALLFADDLAILADSEEQLRAMIGRLEQWCQLWEMKVNANKCGVMEIGVQRSEEEGWRVRIGDGSIPVVKAYTYLGCHFTYDLDLKAMAKHRSKVGLATLDEVRPFISNNTIPIWIRQHVLTSILIPQMLYGAELWGMNEVRCVPVQRVADSAMKLLLSISGSGASLSLNAMREELGLSKLDALAAGQRARAIVKYSTLKTVIALLVNNPLTAQKATWVSGTTRWLNRYAPRHSIERSRASDPSGRLLQDQVRKVIAERELDKDRTVSMAWRTKCRFHSAEETGIIQLTRKHVHLSKGVTQLMRLRCKAFRFAPWLAQVGLIKPEFKDTCPMCMERVRDDEEHLLLNCKTFAEAREGLLASWIGCATRRTVNPGGVITLLLGGELEGRQLDGWSHLSWGRPN